MVAKQFLFDSQVKCFTTKCSKKQQHIPQHREGKTIHLDDYHFKDEHDYTYLVVMLHYMAHNAVCHWDVNGSCLFLSFTHTSCLHKAESDRQQTGVFVEPIEIVGSLCHFLEAVSFNVLQLSFSKRPVCMCKTL